MYTFAQKHRPIRHPRSIGFMVQHGALLRQNHAVHSILKSQGNTIQQKLMINASGDKYEQEADHIAAQVMGMSEQGLTNSLKAVQTTSCEHEELPASGQPLDPDTRAFFEPRFNYDFSKVRVHSSRNAAESAQELNARAFTVGQDIVFGANEYAPKTITGKRLLAHELTHVVQQSPTTERSQSGVASSLSGMHDHTLQRMLVATNEAHDFTELANEIIRFFYRVNLCTGGEVTLRRIPLGSSRFAPEGSDFGVTHLTPAAQELVNVLQQVIGHGVTEINFVHGNAGGYSNISIGGAVAPETIPRHTVDLDDITVLGFQWDMGEERGGTAGALLAHEILEAYRMAVHNETYLIAHGLALEAEARAVGAVRSGTDSDDAHWQRADAVIHDLNVFAYIYPDGSIVDLIMNVVSGNIIETRRAARPYGTIELSAFDYQAAIGLQTYRPVVQDGQARFERL